MRRCLTYFLAVAAFVLTLSCHRGPEVIDRDDLAEIYAEMFLLDQRITGNYSLRRMADTTRVYEAVLQKYGYTFEDFNATLKYYLDDPKRHNRIINNAIGILNVQIAGMEAEQAEIDERKAYAERVKHFRPERVCLLDTLTFLDSLYKFDFQKGQEILFDGPRMYSSSDTTKCYASTK